MSCFEFFWKKLEIYVLSTILALQYLITGSLARTGRVNGDGPYSARTIVSARPIDFFLLLCLFDVVMYFVYDS